ncbi:hypothetical protein HQN90_12200 [Paenibacillus alba]|nr:hypothetical protein [Paenibacillus alba]
MHEEKARNYMTSYVLFILGVIIMLPVKPSEYSGGFISGCYHMLHDSIRLLQSMW